jgi:hypothetical protein
MRSPLAIAGLAITFGAVIVAGVASGHATAQTFVVIWSAICAKALIVLGLFDAKAPAPEVRVVRKRAGR